jgi:colicin import membrane protein
VSGRERDQNNAGTPAWKSPVAFSVGLHLSILVIAISGWSWSSSNYESPPRSISARLISPEPRPASAVTEVDQPDEAEKRLVEDRKLVEQQREVEQQRKIEEQKKKQEADARVQQQAEQKREEQVQEKARAQAENKAQAAEAAKLKANAEAKELARQKTEQQAERERQEVKRKAEEQKQLEEQRKKAEAERQKREKQVQDQAEQKRVEAERRLREQNLKALAQQATDAEADQARISQQAAAASAQEAQMLTDAEKYQELIRARVTEVWYYPSSTTEGMKVQLQLSLLPTGELTGVTLVRGSGNTAFDNSALSAVRSLNRYPVPNDRDTFERYFRRFTIEFTPSR